MKSSFVCGAALAAVLMADAAMPAVNAEERGSDVVVRMTPNVARAPATVQLRVRVEPKAENRRLRVTLDSGSYYRSSELPLEGERAAATHQVRWGAIPSGDYMVVVELVRANGKARLVHAGRLEVVGIAN